MSKSEVSIALPDELIKGLVMAEMAKSLGNREEMIRAVVSAAFNIKADNYDRRTLFEKQTHEAIVNMASNAFKEWLTENAAMVKAAVLRELNKRKAHFADQLAASLLDGRFNVSSTISVQLKQADY